MWHIFPLQLVRHVVMCLLIAGLKDKPLIFSLMLWMISRLPFFSSERENRRVRRERKACFLFFSSTLFYVTSWFMRTGSSLIEICILQELWRMSSYPTPILPPLLQDDPIFNSSSFPHVELISQTLMPMPETSEIYLQKCMWGKKSYDQTFKSLTCVFALILDFPNLHESGPFQFSKRRD